MTVLVTGRSLVHIFANDGGANTPKNRPFLGRHAVTRFGCVRRWIGKVDTR